MSCETKGLWIWYMGYATLKWIRARALLHGCKIWIQFERVHVEARKWRNMLFLRIGTGKKVRKTNFWTVQRTWYMVFNCNLLRRFKNCGSAKIFARQMWHLFLGLVLWPSCKHRFESTLVYRNSLLKQPVFGVSALGKAAGWELGCAELSGWIANSESLASCPG